MSNITVWTKQHENVLKELETSGRYIAKQEYIRMDLKEQDPTFTSGRRSSGSGACKIGAAGAPGNWTGMLWQEWYFFRRFPGGRRC